MRSVGSAALRLAGALGLAGVVAGAVVLAGCQGSGGAVSVRWRLVDLSTGESFDPASTTFGCGNGACCCLDPMRCSAINPWTVQTVGLTLRDPDTGSDVLDVAPFLCTAREKTTPFDLPPGTYAIGLSASVVDASGQAAPYAVPPPEVRTIVRGDVVNLQVIEIGVDPLPLPMPSAMVSF